jgi:menaquinone-dependent protoporphyrinogen IX oxidase
MATNGTGPDRTALVLYGTETGAAQDIAEEAACTLERLYFMTDVTSFDNASTVCLEDQLADIFGSLLRRQTFHPTHSAFLLSLQPVKGTSHPMPGTFGQVY